MKPETKGAIIGAIVGAVGTVLASVIGLIPWMFGHGETTRVVLATQDGSEALPLNLASLPRPSNRVAKVLALLNEQDTRRIVDIALIGRDNSGLSGLCLHTPEDEAELAAFRRLEEIGLGAVHVEEVPERLGSHTVQADFPDVDGTWYARIDPEMLDEMCRGVRVCPRSFSFTPTDLGIETRTFLRDLLVTQIKDPAADDGST
ncbi:hypothetical protein [Paracoccus niistensis]|uniref:Uncharacterized protein n=1 Tax=Paracoccus niistensis TaxID=632935 RepID=A0ABV6I3M3_9RHOB